MCPHGQASIQQQDASVCPWGQEASSVGWSVKGGVVLLDGFVDVLERRWSWCGWADREAEAVGLVEVVVGVLADDDGFHGGKGCMTGPGCSRERSEEAGK